MNKKYLNLVLQEGEGWNRIFDIINRYPLEFDKKPKIKGNSRVVATIFPGKSRTEITKKTWGVVKSWVEVGQKSGQLSGQKSGQKFQEEKKRY